MLPLFSFFLPPTLSPSTFLFLKIISKRSLEYLPLDFQPFLLCVFTVCVASLFVKILWSRKWQPAPGVLPGKSQGQNTLVDHSPWGCKELDTIERLSLHELNNSPTSVLINCSVETEYPNRLNSCLQGTYSLMKGANLR